jgi:hypothetical protein
MLLFIHFYFDRMGTSLTLVEDVPTASTQSVTSTERFAAAQQQHLIVSQPATLAVSNIQSNIILPSVPWSSVGMHISEVPRSHHEQSEVSYRDCLRPYDIRYSHKLCNTETEFTLHSR